MKIFNHNGFINKPLQLWTVLLFSVLPLTAAYSVTIDFTTMLAALSKNSGIVIKIAVATAYIIGLWFIISAVMNLKRVGQSSQMQMQTTSISGPIVKFVIGLMLLYLPSVIDIGAWTLWGAGADSSQLSYTTTGGEPIFGPVKDGAIALVKAVGYIYFIRGLIVLSHSSEQGAQQGTVGKGIVHLIGGILAINLMQTIEIIKSAFGMV
ncbi:MAG: hypothetical protein KKE11_00435 [Gammaproteobacteria bacterium]|nr:hypothetical protein [Gammaproteobacteria bacterium]